MPCFKASLFVGKGTVSGTLQKELGWVPISAGDCLREEKNRYLLWLRKSDDIVEARMLSLSTTILRRV